MGKRGGLTRAAPENRRARSAAYWLAVTAAVCGGILFLYTIYAVALGFTNWQIVLEKHFAAIIGLPGGAALAFAIVVFLRQTDGPIEFEAVGFKFKGASGQVAMWVICFLAIAVAIKLCW
jgi:ABC-type Fe3+ transport system permease subunit